MVAASSSVMVAERGSEGRGLCVCSRLCVCVCVCVVIWTTGAIYMYIAFYIILSTLLPFVFGQ